MGWDANGDDGGDCKKKWLHDEDDDDCDDDTTSESDYPRNPTPPDGGWGWLVTFASFMCNFILDGICVSFGVVQYEYMKEFNASHARVSWIGSALSGSYLLVGPFVSAMCAYYGCRRVTMVGSLVAMLGFALSTQATDVEMMIVFYGIIGGIGFGMIYLPAIVSVGHWFDKKRAFATGIAVGGSGVGQALFPILAHYLLTTYRWQGKNLIMAGIVLNCAVCGAIFRPLDRWMERRRRPINSRVEIERGVIMKALIEHKEKQRTISNGSLDDCVITRDNKLIKLDPALLECKRNNSVLARFKRQLGFSAQSLSISKSSFQDLQNFLVGAIQSKNNSSTILPTADGRQPQPKLPQPCQGSSTPDVYICAPQGNGDMPTLLVNGGAVAYGNGACPSHPAGFPKTRSCDALCRHAQQAEEVSGKSVNGATSLTDLPSTPIPPSMLDASLISIQVVPNCVAESRQSVRHRSSRSMCSEYTPSTAASSHPTFVSANVTSMPQVVDLSAHRDSILWKYWRVLCDMFDLKLMLNPVFALLVGSSLLTLLAYYIPYFYLPEQGLIIGMMEEEANFLLSIMGITNTIGRFIGGWLADRPLINTLHLNNISLILVGFSILACPWCETQALLALMAGLSAFCYGIFIALRSILLVDLLGLDMLTKSFGMLILFQGVAAMIGPPIAGKLADTTGSLDICFFMAGALTILSGLLLFPIRCLRSPESQRGSSNVVGQSDKKMDEVYCNGKTHSQA